MALVDSEGAFEQRLNEVIPDGPARGAIIRAGITSFSSLAFSSGTPQSPPNDEAFRTFAEAVLPAGYSLAVYSAFRRLHFEAAILVVAQLKEKVIGNGDQRKQELPTGEKKSRMAEQRRRSTGIDIEGELQPSYALVDAFTGMIETSSGLWTAPSKSTPRENDPGLPCTCCRGLLLPKNQKVRRRRVRKLATRQSKAGAKPQLKKKLKATKKAERSKPEALADMEAVTENGQDVCWSFNMESGCQAPLISSSKSAKCAKGLRVCASCHKANH